MTDAEFYALSLEEQRNLLNQGGQVNAIRDDIAVDYGAMADPYSAGGAKPTAAPPPNAPPPQMEMPQQQQPSGGGMPPIGLMTQFMGGGSTAATAASGAAPVAIGGTSGAGVAGSAAPAAASSGAAGGGSALASAGPWAALAAAIILNENQAIDKGRRDEDPNSRLVDQFSGAALEQDADKMGDKIGGPLGQATKVVGRLGHPEGLLKTSKKLLKPWEWF